MPSATPPDSPARAAPHPTQAVSRAVLVKLLIVQGLNTAVTRAARRVRRGLDRPPSSGPQLSPP